MAATKLVTILFLAIMVAAPSMSNAAISCRQVALGVASCINYVRTGAGPPPACCAGLRTLNGLARTTADRQQVCKCTLTIAKGIPGLKNDLMIGLPAKCSINLPYKASLNTNCATVK